eukprot:Skav204044  [mRNA]  locus=scaffold3:175211:177055:- [translate_table: standard]
MALDKALLMRNLRAILEDHQRRLLLDLASYVDQFFATAPPPAEKRTQRTPFDPEDVLKAMQIEEVEKDAAEAKAEVAPEPSEESN